MGSVRFHAFPRRRLCFSSVLRNTYRQAAHQPWVHGNGHMLEVAGVYSKLRQNNTAYFCIVVTVAGSLLAYELLGRGPGGGGPPPGPRRRNSQPRPWPPGGSLRRGWESWSRKGPEGERPPPWGSYDNVCRVDSRKVKCSTLPGEARSAKNRMTKHMPVAQHHKTLPRFNDDFGRVRCET